MLLITCLLLFLTVMFKDGVTKCPEVSVPLKNDYLQWALYSKGVQSMREVYRRYAICICVISVLVYVCVCVCVCV